ncbi:MAG: tetratricopeptide repeat protein [Saprospiraceae bacterium]
MPAKIICLGIVLIGLFRTGATAQSPVIDSIQRQLAGAKDDSARWYYTLELSAKYHGTNFDSARMYGERSLELAGDLGKGLCKAMSINTLGAVYWRKGDYETALKYYFEAARLAEACGAPKLHSTALANIGLLYSARHDSERALDYLHKSLVIKFKLRDTLGIMRGLNNLGEALITAGQPDSALVYFERCLPWFDYRPDQVFGKGIVLNNIGTILLDRGDLPQARRYLEQSRQLREQIGDKGGLSVVLENLAQVELGEQHPAQAVAYLEKSLALSRETGSVSDQSTTLKKLAEALAGQNKYAQAYSYLTEHLALQDTLHREESEGSIAEMEVRYQTGQKEAEITRQQLQIEGAKSRQRLLVFVALSILLGVLGLFQYFRNRQRLRQKEVRYALALEQAEGLQLRELDRLKSAFFANISHEFRTPLTLILGPLQKWLGGPAASGADATEIRVPAKDLRMVGRNASRLLDLVGQLLDLSKLESGKLRLSVSAGDVAKILRVIGYSFDSMAEQGGINYRISVPENAVPAWFDRDQLEKIATNLLSNAFKNTAAGGQVDFQAELREDRLFLQVSDSGQGIAADQLDRIFDRFYQVENTGNAMSTGIGLALVKELVALHGGTIQVESQLGEGSVFRVELPANRAAYPEEAIMEESLPDVPGKTNREPGATSGPEASGVGENPSDTAAELPLCLIVEDNADVRDFIRSQLESQFRILLAGDGQAGLALALETMPDLVVSDLMMPGMDGNALCAALKNDERSSHIPVILLTARADQESRVTGLETGADDYLTKPFHPQELQVRALNLVRQREQLRRQFSRTMVLKPQEIALTSADERFLQRIQETLDQRLGEEQFSVEELAAASGMSRSQLHRKLTALIDQPPVEFIRNFRLQRAREMLEAGAGNVSEVGYAVGFLSPAYFSKAFKEAFGLSPSEVLAQR